MNALDRLLTDAKETESGKVTPIEALILACPDPTLRLQAAAQWMQMQSRVQYKNLADMSELNSTDVDQKGA